MALEYKSQIGLDVIMPVLDEYVVWYGMIVKSFFDSKPMEGTAPPIFNEWLFRARAENNINELTAEHIMRIHEDMVKSAMVFTARAALEGGNPPLEEYVELSRHYEEFIQVMRRLELDHATENSGFDEKTGLRSMKLMRDDVAREMERRARRGNPFSIALVKINDFDEECSKDELKCREMIKKISDQIKACLRSFDDAYYLGNEYFLLSLKHADMLGSQAAVARLNQGIMSAHIHKVDDPLEEISISTVVSEPAQGDSLDDLLDNMKKDLEGIDAKGTVLQYNDISPLQRYIYSIAKEK